MYAKWARKYAVVACALALSGAALGSEEPVRSSADYQGIWQNAPTGSESGWAIAFAPQGHSVYATWFTYDTDGSPMWLALTAQDIADLVDGSFAPQTVFVGELNRATLTVDGAGQRSVSLVPYGPAAIEFAAPDLASFSYNIDGTWRAKAIERAYVAGPVAACSDATPADGLYTDAASITTDDYPQGMHVAHEGDSLVATWFTYDAQGKSVWRVMAATPSAPDVYTGAIYQTRGPAVTTTFDPALVEISAVGTGTFSFAADGGTVFSYVVDGAPSAIAIRPPLSVKPLSACEKSDSESARAPRAPPQRRIGIPLLGRGR